MKKKTNTTARQHTSSLISELMTESSPLEKAQVKNRMELAAKIEDLLIQKKWNKKEFAKRVGKHPSEITKWLSGTHNFTMDILTEISVVLEIPLSDLFAKKQVQTLNRVTVVVSSKQVPVDIHYTTPNSGLFTPEYGFNMRSSHKATLPLTFTDN
jgi:transcriptional regulator with XRE-family HTH domain